MMVRDCQKCQLGIVNMLVRDGQNMIQGLSKIELENCQNCCCIVSSCQKKRLSSYCCLLCHRIRHVMSRFCQNHVRVKSGSCQSQCRVICKGHVKIISKAVRVMQGPFQDHVKVRLCQGHFCLSNIAQPWRLKGFSVLFLQNCAQNRNSIDGHEDPLLIYFAGNHGTTFIN